MKIKQVFNKLLEGEETIQDSIINYFSSNPNPSDKDVHALAKSLNMDEHKFEEEIYKVLSSLVNLKGYDAEDTEFDPKELEIGIRIEKEHHNHPLIRKNIAKAHLLELDDYYTRLVKMEKEGKANI